MRSTITTVQNQTGLHARPASEFVKSASKFAAKIEIGRANETEKVNAKSIIMLLTLALEKGTQVEIVADGADETIAIETLISLIDSKFGEE